MKQTLPPGEFIDMKRCHLFSGIPVEFTCPHCGAEQTDHLEGDSISYPETGENQWTLWCGPCGDYAELTFKVTIEVEGPL